MSSYSRLLLILLLVSLSCPVLFAETILFDDHIDSRQKTELRFEVPDGCVITGLGFRAAAYIDNVRLYDLSPAP